MVEVISWCSTKHEHNELCSTFEGTHCARAAIHKEKCKFGITITSYLGHMNENKLKAVTDMPRPSSRNTAANGHDHLSRFIRS